MLELERISPRIWYNSLETDLCGSRPAALHRPPVFYFGFQVSSTRARNTKWGDAWTSVRDRESRNRGSEVSIIGYVLAATRVLRPLAV